MNEKSAKFFSLYTSIHGRLYSYIMMMVHNQAVAEDLLQETAVIMWENFETFQEGTNFGAWAVRIARNKTLEFLRENKNTKKLFRDEFYNRVSAVAEDSTQNFSQRMKALDECMKKLSKPDQNILRLRYKNNVPIKNISVRTGWPVSTLYHRLSRIYGVLRSCISRTLAQQET